jgi:isopenicillin N synthase-like dioxygenase
VIDISALRSDGSLLPEAASVGRAIDAACRDAGFFYVTGHGVDPELQRRLDSAARAFFARPDDEKAAIAMAKGGRAWRGWFPVGGELTSGVPDLKEGLYFGAELGAEDPRVAGGEPLHGSNLFPDDPADLRHAVLEYLDAMTAVAHDVVTGLELGLGLPAGWFRHHLTSDPLVLFRIFHYPPSPGGDDRWGVGEHTDYGLLTLLLQDQNGGLQVRSGASWIDAPPVEGSFVCNIGDMLDRMTGGRYRSTPHRVLNRSGADRLSFPFFFDPSWDAEVRPLPLPDPPPEDDANRRWDRASVHVFDGTYGEYVMSKVSKVFPDLAAGSAVITPASE